MNDKIILIGFSGTGKTSVRKAEFNALWVRKEIFGLVFSGKNLFRTLKMNPEFYFSNLANACRSSFLAQEIVVAFFTWVFNRLVSAACGLISTKVVTPWFTI